MNFKPEYSQSLNKTNFFRSLQNQLESLLVGERNWVCNLSQFCGFIYQMLPDLNWAGFYMVDGNQLILGPYQGQVACTPIAMGKGVCGKVAMSGIKEIVTNVSEFEGHIACDSASQSELVFPVIINNKLVAVFDLDSPTLARFEQQDADGIEQLIRILINQTDWPEKRS